MKGHYQKKPISGKNGSAKQRPFGFGTVPNLDSENGLKAACTLAQPGKKTASRSRGANKQQQFSGRRVLQHCSNCGSIGKVAHTPTVICKNSIQQRLKLEIPWTRSEEAAQEGDPKVDKKAGKIGQTCDTRWKMDTNYQLVIK